MFLPKKKTIYNYSKNEQDLYAGNYKKSKESMKKDQRNQNKSK